MIIHKSIEDKQPHEGLEYHHKSKEPETFSECNDLWCWECVFDNVLAPINCKKRIGLKGK